jgi:hypothetical protein
MKISSFACVVALAAAVLPPVSAEAANGGKSAKSKPLRVTVTRHGKRIGGYSYKKSESISVKEILRFTNPPRQTPNGPFDSGFFFNTPTPPYGGSSPYMQ